MSASPIVCVGCQRPILDDLYYVGTGGPFHRLCSPPLEVVSRYVELISLMEQHPTATAGALLESWRRGL